MAYEFRKSVAEYRMAKNLPDDDPNKEFNLESSSQSVIKAYLKCIILCGRYAALNNISLIVRYIVGRKNNMSIKLERGKERYDNKLMTIGVERRGDISIGVKHEVHHPFEFEKYLINQMGFTGDNLNDTTLDSAMNRLEKIATEKNIKIEEEETKKWTRVE